MNTNLAELPEHAGEQLGTTAWRTVTQDQVDAFADLTEDPQPDPCQPTACSRHALRRHDRPRVLHGVAARAAARGAAARRWRLAERQLRDRQAPLSGPVPVGARFRASAELAEVTEVKGGVQIRIAATVEVENSPKPALVAECLFRHYA